MTRFDGDLVDRWFDHAGGPQSIPYLSLSLSDEEDRALLAGRAAVQAALTGERGPAWPPVSERSASWLQQYLQGTAAGIAGARAAEGGPPGQSTPLHLVAGLITGAAAVSGLEPPPDSAGGSVRRPPGAAGAPAHGTVRELSPAESAHRAGAAAAEEAVDGAGLPEVAQAAGLGALQGWVLREPQDPHEQATHRAHVLLARLLRGLQAATTPETPDDPLPPVADGWRAACQDTPWDPSGETFLAEITFAVADGRESVDRLVAALDGRQEWFGLWGGQRGQGFHIHTRDPGAVLSEVFSVLTPFELTITRLADDPD